MAGDKRRKRGARSKRIWILVGLAAFVVLDVGLVGLALSQGRGDAGDDPDRAPDASATQTSPSEEPSATPTPTTLAPPTSYLSAVDSTTAYRTAAGSCAAASPAVLEKTSDAGANWTSSVIPTGLSSIVRLQAIDESYAFAVGLEASTCAPGLTATYTSGLGFQTYPDRLASAWYLDPATPAVVHSPGGDVAAPCATPHSLAVSSDLGSLVLCNDATVFETQDGGDSWSARADASGGLSVTAASDGGYRVARLDPACAGMSVATLTAAGTTTASGCNPSVAQTATDVVISEGDDALWMQSAGRVFISEDGGLSWG